MATCARLLKPAFAGYIPSNLQYTKTDVALARRVSGKRIGWRVIEFESRRAFRHPRVGLPVEFTIALESAVSKMAVMATLQFRQLFADGTPFRTLFDALSAMVFIVDDRLMVHDANLEAARALGPQAELLLKRLCGEVLRCLNSGVDPKAGEAGPCGDTVHCSECVLRKSTTAALAGEPTTRRPYSMRLLVGSTHREAHFVVTATPFEYGGQRYVMLVLEDVTALRELRKIVPICAWCHKVYVSGDYHAGLEQRLREQALIDYTHGICPACAREQFPSLAIESEPAP